jgi:hypothetical protein
MYQCPYCSQSFSIEATFRFHEYAHEWIEELNILTPAKLQKFSQSGEGHYDNNLLVQTCRWCSTEFWDNEELFHFHEQLQSGNQTGAGKEPADGQPLKYSFTKLNEKRFKKNGAIDRHFVVKSNSNTVQSRKKIVEVQDELSEMFDATLAQFTENHQGKDLIRVLVHSDSFITPIFVPLQKISSINSTVIMDHINHVLTSRL